VKCTLVQKLDNFSKQFQEVVLILKRMRRAFEELVFIILLIYVFLVGARTVAKGMGPGHGTESEPKVEQQHSGAKYAKI